VGAGGTRVKVDADWRETHLDDMRPILVKAAWDPEAEVWFV